MASRGPFGKGNIQAAREFLAGMPEFTEHSKKGAFGIGEPEATRTANAFTKQLQAGVTPNYQAARGHILTPEHGPRGARPKLPEKAENYQRAQQRSKETTRTAETTPASSQRRTAALTGEPRRPLFHKRPPFQGHIPYGEGGEIYTRRSEAEAKAVLRYAAELGPTHGERVVMQGYDCSKGRWFPVFRNAGHGQGINASVLLEMWRDHGGSLEAFLMALINDASYRDRSRITHICLYEVTILPRDLPAVTALKQRMGNGR